MNPDDLVTVYRDAYLLMLERIADQTARGNITSYSRALLADLETILGELDEEATAWIAQAVPATYREGMNATITALREMGEDVTAQARIVGIHREAVEVLAENAASDLLEANQQVGRRARDSVRRAGLQATTQKVATGSTVRQAKEILLNRLMEQGLTTAGGMRIDSYAALVARSTTREATNLGRINMQTELGHDLVTIPRHVPTCDICSAFQGRVYSISGNDPRFPALYQTAFDSGYNNIHPNCGHSVVPWVEVLRDEDEKQEALERSNEPFEDNRSVRERNAYNDGRAKRTAARKRRLAKEEGILEKAKPPQAVRVPPSERMNVAPDVQAASPSSVDDFLQLPGGTEPVAVRMTELEPGMLGEYVRAADGSNNIGLSKLTPRSERAAAFAHEYGHYVDRVVLGGGSRWGSLSGDADVERVMQAIRGTPQYRALTLVPDGPAKAVAEYASSGEELFARAFAQYAAKRTSSEQLRVHMRNQMRRLSDSAGPVFPHTQWDDESFEPIAGALDALFRGRGMLK